MLGFGGAEVLVFEVKGDVVVDSDLVGIMDECCGFLLYLVEKVLEVDDQGLAVLGKIGVSDSCDKFVEGFKVWCWVSNVFSTGWLRLVGNSGVPVLITFSKSPAELESLGRFIA